MQHEVFISYHRNSSAELVEHIVAALESHGIKCWYAPRDVDSSYAAAFIDRLKQVSKECEVEFYVSISANKEELADVNTEGCKYLN